MSELKGYTVYDAIYWIIQTIKMEWNIFIKLVFFGILFNIII